MTNLHPDLSRVIISSEDIVYLDEKPVTFDELGDFLKGKNTNSIFIKSDRDASLGVVVEVWDLCKKNNIEKIGIATTYQD